MPASFSSGRNVVRFLAAVASKRTNLKDRRFYMICKREGCNEEFSEKPVRPSFYKGGRYREYCSDACRMAQTRREKDLTELNLSMNEVITYQDLMSKFFMYVRRDGREPHKHDYTDAHKYAKEKIEARRKFSAIGR